MRRLVLPTAAGLALVASAGLASAQPHERGGVGPGGPGGGAVHGPGGSMHAPGGGVAPRGELSGPHGYQPEHSNRAEPPGHRAEPSRRAEPEHRTEPTRRADPQRNQERRRTTEQEQRRAAEDKARADRQREQERNAERERAKEKNVPEEQRRAQERDRTGQDDRLGERHHEIEQARTRLSMQDRDKLHRAFDFERARVSKVNFDHHVGHRVPRTVHLFPLTREVIAFFPYYRDYEYFVAGDEICIVNPATYEVVDVIDEGYWRAPGRHVAGLRLGPSQIALVRESIPRDFPEANVRLRLALGAEIPDDVELYEFPRIVTDQVPELREFRFLVADDQIVIVDPNDRSIALVIDRA